MSKPKLPEPRPDPMIERDLIGYGEFSPDPAWPGGARIAVNFNLNVEGGGEFTLANGDGASEGMLNDIGVSSHGGRRVPLVESDTSSTAAGVAPGGCSTSSPSSQSPSACWVSCARSSKIRSWRGPA